MKNMTRFVIVLLLISLTVLACGSLAPTETVPGREVSASQEPSMDATAIPTFIPISSSTPTSEPLQLEVVQIQSWTDPDGNVRANFLLRNPYDFPVAPAFRARGNLLNSAGEFMRDQQVYFLDGISGGTGFLLPGEMVAANACFTCEREPLTEEWKLVEFASAMKNASSQWEYYTDVEATVGSVSFEGDNPIFWINGTVKNNRPLA